ncbi:MAG TPA: alcohol dehydrogenase catalytic domain-containing protein [Candidatus Dormibacteraeota bacterium]|nr:alcohol dehydrogenase catalytic domain-containing protein [Candidatus Dormibacteraeota bacterium]
MKAVVWQGPNRMAVDEWARPELAAEWVALRPEAAGICGSEVEGYMGRQANRRPPLVMGHEFAGVVVEIGPGADPAWLGRHVAVNPIVSCRVCALCRAGRRNLCPRRRLIGVHEPGGFAELVTAPQSNLVTLPEGMGARVGALAEPLANGVHAARLALAETHITGVGAVIGAGAIGVLALQAARAAPSLPHGGRGSGWGESSSAVDRLHVLELDPARRGQAAALGADAAHGSPDDLREALRRETGGLGADFAIDAVGRVETRQLAVASVRPGGRVVLLGLHDDATSFGAHDLVRREVHVTGSYAYTDADFGHALDLLADGRAGLGELPSVQPLEAAPALFARLAAGPTPEVKLFVAPRR